MYKVPREIKHALKIRSYALNKTRRFYLKIRKCENSKNKKGSKIMRK